MAAADGVLTLRGGNTEFGSVKRPSQSAILCKIDDDLIQEAREASLGKDGLQFITGTLPALRIGSRNIDLSLSPEDFRHELYLASIEPFNDLRFAGLVSHKAELRQTKHSGSDAALAALQSSLASHQQKKEANAAVITSSLLPPPKNRHDAAREQRQARRTATGSHSSSQDAGPSRSGTGQASALADQLAAKSRAMRTSLIHLLAIRPISRDDMRSVTRIPKHELDDVLQRIGQKQADGRYILVQRAYKELDVWTFKYRTQAERQSAIDNAVKAYDRLRLSKEDKEWQMLLPKEERGKGKVLSKLLAGTASSTPLYTTSPVPHSDPKLMSSAETPRSGAIMTPKVGASKGDAVSRLLSRDPKRARATDEAKGKKRKAKEAVASATDGEGGKPTKKKQATKINNPKIKSQEIVHSSADEDSADEIVAKQYSSGTAIDKTTLKSESKALNNVRKVAGDSAIKQSPKSKAGSIVDAKKSAIKPGNGKVDVTSRPRSATTVPPASASSKTIFNPKNTATAATARAAGKVTPNVLSAQYVHRTQFSPQGSSNRPTVPSPLGAARPRGTSDVSSENVALSGQRSLPTSAAPRTTVAVNGAKKQSEISGQGKSVTVNGSSEPYERARKANGVTARKAPATNGHAQTTSSPQKRKYDDSPIQAIEAAPASKHRKTDSSQSIEGTSDSKSPYGSPNSIIDNISYKQAVDLAEQFQKFYPRYDKLYSEQEAKEARGEKVSLGDRKKLLSMHARLKQMKAEIYAGSEKEHMDD